MFPGSKFKQMDTAIQSTSPILMVILQYMVISTDTEVLPSDVGFRYVMDVSSR